MTIIPLGKIQVPTPGTPVQITLTAAQSAQLHKSGVVAKMEIWADTGDTGISYVKHAATGLKIASLPLPAGGHCEHWEGRHLNPTTIAIDASAANNGPEVTLWVE
jgi:hypothetical protein